MIDGKYKTQVDKVWNRMGYALAHTGLSPNQVTWIGLGLVLLNCALLFWHESAFWFGAGLAVAFCFDGLDGAVARINDCPTKYGGYLDGVLDRYQEVLVFLAIAAFFDLWAVSFLVITGALLTSYNKARTAIEIAIDNDRWPDFLERLERLVLVCVILMTSIFFSEKQFLFWAFLVLGVLTHLTAFQRFVRARKLLLDSSSSSVRSS